MAAAAAAARADATEEGVAAEEVGYWHP